MDRRGESAGARRRQPPSPGRDPDGGRSGPAAGRRHGGSRRGRHRQDDGGYRPALADPAGSRLLIAGWVSEIGDFVGLGALLWYAHDLTGSLAATGALFTVQAVPALLVALGSRRVAELDRRRWLPGVTAAGAAALALPVVVPTLPGLLVAAFLLGAARVVTASLRSATVTSDIPVELRGRVLALSTTGFQVAQVAGYLTGPAIAAVIGPAPALLLDAVTFLVAAAVLVGLPHGAGEEPVARPGPFAGLSLLSSRPLLAVVAPLTWATLLYGAIPETLSPGIAPGHLVGVLMASHPAGVAAGSWLLGRNRLLERTDSILTLSAAGAATAFAVAAAVWFGLGTPVVAAAVFLLGVSGASLVGVQAVLTRVCTPKEAAQVAATLAAGLVVLEGVGAAAAGALADLVSPAASYAMAATVLAAATGLGLVRAAALPARRRPGA